MPFFSSPLCPLDSLLARSSFALSMVMVFRKNREESKNANHGSSVSLESEENVTEFSSLSTSLENRGMSRKYWSRVGNTRSIDWNAMEKRNENRACSKGNKTIQTGEFLPVI